MKKIMVLLIILGFMAAGCASSALVKKDDAPAGKQSVIASDKPVDVWLSPALTGDAPFRTLNPGDEVKVLSTSNVSALIEMKDGSRGFVDVMKISK
ncbi:MAG: hypothetical protein BWY84_00340 [Candidatus Aerophobetes bacterium ADurb.Bin490]|nr:MAG: hypothetical protein BWY84_00340 [Candidatus Aerophobetes bacterium ADurb.Bin490]HNZ28957.1 hypothetical protein [Candidatus Goldiibacteriota bacterium]HPI02919.1 hypothetical protein [Candidatus Goldiibacteriota bacterium]HPN64018.1 hypothetical protein [Candidatus Goldiibacteriota bacterium]HRQ42808.1 hypothetical protein [Candidatus Goldiibacteriota bacterium]